MALTNEDLKGVRAAVCDTVWRIVNRNVSDDPSNDGKLSREGVKTAAQQQFNTYFSGTLPVS
ncbi:hypothetical protein J2Y63_001391 [Shinella sp. BE166]|uniref:hypothetical protein n=1 Tax=Shinella sp. BE166 TaxID=3373918 RepID=UPI003EBC59E6